MKNSIYEFIEVSDKKDTSGHILNKYVCKECGKVVYRRNSSPITTKCHHWYKPKEKNINYGEELYNIYKGMICRCDKPNDKTYEHYGARGIKICDEWKDDFMNFYNWSINNGYKKGLTIDRIDVNGNYEPSNCRWVTREFNARYKSTTRIICVNGISKSGREWSKFINRGTNYINTMIRKKGLDYTKKYLEEIIGA